MNTKRNIQEALTVILASLILSLIVSFDNKPLIYYASLSFLIIIGSNVLIKKAVGYFFEVNVRTSFWKMYQFGFRKDKHFKFPLPMVWFPILLAIFSRGIIWWFAILEFDVEAKTERVSRRHGLYRFSEVTEWHMGIIAMWGIVINLLLAVVGYLLGYEFFAKLSIYYAVWSIIPASSLDGTKILFANKGLWLICAIVAIIFLGWGLVIKPF